MGAPCSQWMARSPVRNSQRWPAGHLSVMRHKGAAPRCPRCHDAVPHKAMWRWTEHVTCPNCGAKLQPNMGFWMLLGFTSLAVAPIVGAIVADSYWNLGIFWASVVVAIALAAICVVSMWRNMQFITLRK